MSGKFTKNRKNKKRNGPVLMAIAACVLALAVLLLFMFRMESGDERKDPAQQTEQDQPNSGEAAASGQLNSESSHDLGNGITIDGFISYTGAFMEDRTDEVVTDVLGIRVTNAGDKYIQTMDITLSAGETQAEFSLSSLFPGETVVVLEKNRMSYSTAPEFDQVRTDAVALFESHPGMCEDKLEIQCLNGVINVTNISGADITGDILIYYKNYVSGMYYGGITYRLRIQGGLKAGEIRQGSAAHFNPDNSAIVFVTCG